MEQVSSTPIKSKEGWVKTTLGGILCESKEKFSPHKGTNKKYLGLEHIEKDIGSLNGYGNSNETLSTKNAFNNGDLLYGKLRPYLNKVAVPDFSGVCSTDILVFKKHDYLFNNFIKYRLLSRDFVNFAQLNVSGVQHPRINKKTIDNFSINLPPLTEQHYIVEKIEELFSKLDNGVASLKKAREQLKTYRQAVLKYAFEGKLTQEWREQQIQAGNPPEPAEKLLARIKKEREAHYQKQIDAWQKACEQAKKDGSKKPAKPKKPKDLPPLTEKELAELTELPEGWGWNRIEGITTVLGDGLHGTPVYSDEGDYYFINGNNLSGENIEFKENTKRVTIEEYEKYKKPLSQNTVLVSINGTLGNTAFYNNERIVLGKSACYFNLIGVIDKQYVRYCITSQRFKNYAYKMATGSTIKNVSLKAMREFAIPTPSTREEQQAIVSEVETRLSVCDQLEQTIEDSLKKAEALRQSILKKAFEGELTREWREAHPELISGENSAESLLARIRAEKARADVSRKRSRLKKTK